MIQFRDLLCKALTAHGAQVYQVGGSVRDTLLGLEQKDIDLLVTQLPASEIGEILSAHGQVDWVGKSFGVFKVTDGTEYIDVAVPRTERTTGTHHRDFDVQSGPDISIEEDLSRRDFTINAMAQLLSSPAATLIDPYGGQEDLKKRKLRAVGNPTKRFQEDPLRMLRLARFMAQLDFFSEEKTQDATAECAHLIQTVSGERIQQELLRLLSSRHSQGIARSLRFLRDTGLLGYIIPEFKDTFGFDQHNPYHHLTLDEHIFAAVEYAASQNFSLECRLALLLHDLGKPKTQSFDPQGIAHYYKHECVGSDLAKDILERLKFSLCMKENIVRMVHQHMRPPKDATLKVLRRFIHDMGEVWEKALELRESDMAAHAGKAQQFLGWSEEMKRKCQEISPLAHFDERNLAVSGHVLTLHFGVHNREIGVLKRWATQAVIDGTLRNEQTEILDWLTQKRLESQEA